MILAFVLIFNLGLYNHSVSVAQLKANPHVKKAKDPLREYRIHAAERINYDPHVRQDAWDRTFGKINQN